MNVAGIAKVSGMIIITVIGISQYFKGGNYIHSYMYMYAKFRCFNFNKIAQFFFEKYFDKVACKILYQMSFKLSISTFVLVREGGREGEEKR